MIMNSITFLGTGGGRSVVFSQVRASGGIYFELDGKRFILDPGPGSLVNMRQMKLKEPHGLLISHYHVDHISDARTLLDGMKEPFLIAEENVISGDDNSPGLGKYHVSKAAFLKSLKAGDSAKIPKSEIKIIATKCKHTSPCIGFMIEGSKKIGYVSDTTYFKGVQKPFEGSDLLVFNVLVPWKKDPIERKHLSADEATDFIKNLEKKPKLAIIQHFSFWMLQNNVYAQAKMIEKETGVKTIAAKDFMKVDIDKLKEEKKGLERFGS